MKPLVAVDMFCGAGGFTEGFKQSGFDVAACLDNWSPAVVTHRKNHPETEVFEEDILDFDSSRLPRMDVLIGSPPCTQFSYANRGGHGDVGLGMRFVLRFLRMVHELKPRYWIMENVPRLLQSLPSRVPLRRMGLNEDGFVDIPVRRILNSADFGAPQKRLRLVSGRFPLPSQTHAWTKGLENFSDLSPWVPVQSVVGILPDPLGVPDSNAEAQDPVYDLEIPQTDLTDHFVDTRLSLEEIRINQKSKTDHSWYGRMAFPDPLDRPARTVMATQTGISRETLVIEWMHGGRRFYRRPTIRECASFQCFPVTYQFWGSTAHVRYKLVGNAVPALLASALARSIASREGAPLPRVPKLTRSVGDRPAPVDIVRKRARRLVDRLPADRKFRDHIPGSKAGGVRVDLANLIVHPLPSREELEVRWEARLVSGSGKAVITVVPGLSAGVRAINDWAERAGEAERTTRLYAGLARRFADQIPNAQEFQEAWTERAPKETAGPQTLLRQAANVVDASFPAVRFESEQTPVPAFFPPLGRGSIAVRRLAQLVAVAFIAEASNDGTATRALTTFSEATASAPATRGARQRSILEKVAGGA